MKVIAHRGYSAAYPENTLLAFKKAIEAGANGIETDIRLSLDHIPFCFHDDSLKRLTGLDRAPEELRMQELQALNIHQEKIPTLEELLQLAEGKITVILEIKYNPLTYKQLCDALIPLIHDKLDWVEISCFDDQVLEYMHLLHPPVRLHKLVDSKALLQQEDFEIRYDYTNYFDIDVSLRDYVRKTELVATHKVIYWTVDTEDITADKEAGLYAIMSNDPSKFV